MTSLMPAERYGYKRANTAMTTIDLSFGISTFRNPHFHLVWYLLSVCLKLQLSSKTVLCFVCECSWEFPTRRGLSLLGEWVMVVLYKLKSVGAILV